MEGVDMKPAHSGPHSKVLSRWKLLSSLSRLLVLDSFFFFQASSSRWATVEAHCRIWEPTLSKVIKEAFWRNTGSEPQGRMSTRKYEVRPPPTTAWWLSSLELWLKKQETHRPRTWGHNLLLTRKTKQNKSDPYWEWEGLKAQTQKEKKRDLLRREQWRQAVLREVRFLVKRLSPGSCNCIRF